MSRRRPFALVALAAAVLAAGCATGPKWPEAPLSIVGHPLPPYEIHEECARLAAGDKLEFAFESSESVHFNVHYHEGKSVLMPITRDGTHGEAGIFPVALAQDYCAMWEAGPAGALIDYRLRIRRSGR
jgi:hypothetical protein